ncbi:proline rich transmembrane protein 1B [Trichomycterus rosablanca]|uniref:proline rich transmembrane protein 1B n=1 Tax=Trichomycterus rosablanca TaxID=2290929 RepID=UPI002F35BDF2
MGSPPHVSEDQEPHLPAVPVIVQEVQPHPRPQCPPSYDSISNLTTVHENDTDSIQTRHQMTDGDSIQTANPANDSDSARTGHLTCDTDSNHTLNPVCDTDSTRGLHPAYDIEQTAPDGEASTANHVANLPEEPPPYSPPDPKLAYLVYPPSLSQYSNQSVLACQLDASSPAFYQPSFLPTSTYPSYTIYMNGAPLSEEQSPLPKDYLMESLLVTIFCCLMSGLVALMYSFETRAALARGDIQEGERASQKARLLVMISLMFGIFVFICWIIYGVVTLCS